MQCNSQVLQQIPDLTLLITLAQFVRKLQQSKNQRAQATQELNSNQGQTNIIQSAVLPYFTYCHLVWHFCRCSDGRKLERLQERGLKAVYKDKHASYPQLLKRTELPTLLNRRLQDICILMYAEVKHNLYPTFSIYTLSDLGNSSNLIGQLSRTMTFYKITEIVRVIGLVKKPSVAVRAYKVTCNNFANAATSLPQHFLITIKSRKQILNHCGL